MVARNPHFFDILHRKRDVSTVADVNLVLKTDCARRTSGFSSGSVEGGIVKSSPEDDGHARGSVKEVKEGFLCNVVDIHSSLCFG